MIDGSDIYKQPFGGALGQEFKRVWHAIKTNQILPAPGLRMSKTSGGTVLHTDPSVAGASVVTMRVGSSQPGYSPVGYADFLRCYLDGGTSKGLDDLVVALPPKLRPAIKPQYGATIRDAYDTDDVIYAVELDKAYEIPAAQVAAHTLASKDANYLDLNVDGRHWSISVTHCQNEVTSQFWIPVTKYP